MPDTPTQKVLEALYRHHGEHAKQVGKGWSARCPAHEDRRPSLSVAEGDDGRALVRCHVGCSVEAICEALGLTVADLMPDRPIDVDTTSRKPGKTGVLSTSTPGNGRQRTFPTAREAVAELERRRGKRSALWTYHNACGEPVGLILRWDRPDGKDIRPIARDGDGWIIGGMREPRPLYRLPDLADAKLVFVAEGEKCVEAARSIGLVATTSPHGSKSAEKADWSPLAGKQVVILPDNDQPGRAYGDAVASLLVRLKPAPVVKLVDLPDLPEGGDLVDWIDAHHDVAEPDELRRQVEDLVDAAEPIETANLTRPQPVVLRWRPYPTDALPRVLREYVSAVAMAMRVDPACPALAALAAASACVGTTRAVSVKRRWREHACLWAVIVAEQGTGKSPPMREAIRPLSERQQRELEAFAQRWTAYQRDAAEHDKAMGQWRRSRAIEPPPDPPERPTVVRHLVHDATLEALGPILLENPRGLLLDADELSGWLGGMDRYTRAQQADAATWRRIFDSHSITIDRKTGRQIIHVPRPFVAIAGTVQPVILRRALGVEHLESGLAARLLLAYPPARPIKWHNADIPESIEGQYEDVLAKLLALEHETDADGQMVPGLVDLGPEARKQLVLWHDAHRAEQVDLEGVLSGHWAKLVAYCVRLALLVHLVRQADGEPVGPAIDAESMATAITLVKWHKREARRVYAMLDESEGARERRRLDELIQRKGGSATARDLMRSSQKYRTAAEAESALDDLAKAGIGRWEDSGTTARGGRPTRRLTLVDTTDVDTTPSNPEENRGCVNVNGVDGAENTDRANDLLAEAVTDDADDWGAV